VLNGSVLTCSLSTLPVGDAVEAIAWIRSTGQGILPTQVTVSSDQPDDDPSDNTFSTTFRLKGDADADRLPDDWEQANGLDSANSGDALADADADGGSNLQEYLAGTNPRSASSALLLVATRSGDRIVLQFPSVAGRLYRIESTSAVPSVLWEKVLDLDGSGRTLQAEAPLDGKQKYYRVRLLLAGGP
jgi:hypothetical protein